MSGNLWHCTPEPGVRGYIRKWFVTSDETKQTLQRPELGVFGETIRVRLPAGYTRVVAVMVIEEAERKEGETVHVLNFTPTESAHR
jgi:hypothetical protein